MKDPHFDPERRVILPASVAAINEPRRADVTPGIAWISRGAAQFQLQVAAAVPSVLVISQIYYPGWKAWVDGENAEVLPANYALTAIAVPPGTHRVRFAFEPASFHVGMWISLAATVVVGLLIFQGVRQYRSSSQGCSESV